LSHLLYLIGSAWSAGSAVPVHVDDFSSVPHGTTQQDSQYTYNVTLRGVRATTVAVEKQ
jgi:hypothetical protein